MKVMLVNGSPHKEGNTNAALMEITNTLNKEEIETEIFWIGNKAVSGCTACMACFRLKKCAIDDVVNEFREIAKDADGYIFGSPVHFAGASGNMTSFMDRLFYSELLGNRNAAFYLKPAACVTTARRAGTTATYDQMNKYFGLLEMPIISSNYWNMVHGGRPGDVSEDKEGLHTMRVLARNMAFFLRCKQAGLQSGVKLPEKEAPVMTNFIR